MGGGYSREQVDGIRLRGDDHYESVEQVTQDLQRYGLESCNLIVGVDFTKSNGWKGRMSFGGRCLHDISGIPNPYEQVIGTIEKTLSRFDEDGQVPFFGFGDASTHDQEVFSFYPDRRRCYTVSEGLARYREIVPHVKLSGPTSFAPIIEMATEIVKDIGYYHILLIIADGQVTGCNSDCLSFQEERTMEAIITASRFPLSIILVGVGDGPWNRIEQYVKPLPARCFDNFQFVNFSDIMSRNIPEPKKEAEFALEALRKIPSQYRATTKLQMNCHEDLTRGRTALPPPVGTATGTSLSLSPLRPSYQDPRRYNLQICSACSWNLRDMFFGYGQVICCGCGENLQSCPVCHQSIHVRAMLGRGN